jgi:phosphatidylserine decarboxylase
MRNKKGKEFKTFFLDVLEKNYDVTIGNKRLYIRNPINNKSVLIIMGGAKNVSKIITSVKNEKNSTLQSIKDYKTCLNYLN